MILIVKDVINIEVGYNYDITRNIIYVRDKQGNDLPRADTETKGAYTLTTNLDVNTLGTYDVKLVAIDSEGNREEDDWKINVEEPVAGYEVWKSGDAYTQIYTYLTSSMGMNKAQACGVLANMIRESGLNPNADNGIGYYGLCQWGGGRLDNLWAWCGENGLDASTIEGQIKFFGMELPSRYPNTYNQLMACPDTEEGAYSAGYIIGRGYEVAGEDYANQGGYRAQELYRR